MRRPGAGFNERGENQGTRLRRRAEPPQSGDSPAAHLPDPTAPGGSRSGSLPLPFAP